MRMVFPFNYFTTCFSPKKILLKRNQLRWWQICLIFIFLLSLLILPVPFFYQQQNNTDIRMYMPNVDNLLKNSELNRIASQTNYKSGKYSFGKEEKIIKDSKQSIVGINLRKKNIDSHQVAVSLNENTFIFKDKGIKYQLYYTKLYAPNQHNLRNNLEKTWFLRNKAAISFAMMTLVFALFFLTNSLFVFGAALFLWLARKSPAITINSYKEAVTIMLSIIGPITLITMIIEFVNFDISLAITSEMMLSVLYMLVVYAKTHFNEHYVVDERNNQR